MEGYLDIAGNEYGEYALASGKALMVEDEPFDVYGCYAKWIEDLILLDPDGEEIPHKGNEIYYATAEKHILNEINKKDWSDWFQSHVMD